MMELFSTFSWIVTMLFIVILLGLLACGAIIVLMVIGKLLWVVLKEPLTEMYFDFLDWKEKREKTKYSRKRKHKVKWYENYSTFR